MSGIKGKSGRKPDDVNLKIIERLTPLDDKAFEMLKQGIEAGDFKFIRLYFEMRWGKARQMTEVTVTNLDPPPLFNLINFTTREE
jgi:hypothetical protein